jgi:hypothetical protein
MKPTVGRIVHYQAYGTPGGEFKSVPRAAIIAGIATGASVPQTTGQSEEDYANQNAAEEWCDIVVLNPQGLFFNRSRHAPGDAPTPGCWNWPPRGGM